MYFVRPKKSILPFCTHEMKRKLACIKIVIENKVINMFSLVSVKTFKLVVYARLNKYVYYVFHYFILLLTYQRRLNILQRNTFTNI